VRLLRLTPRTPLPVSIVAVARPCARVWLGLSPATRRTRSPGRLVRPRPAVWGRAVVVVPGRAAARRAVATPCPVDEVVVSVPQPLALARSVRSLSLLVSASIAY
jgi:hypothetical protein